MAKRYRKKAPIVEAFRFYPIGCSDLPAGCRVTQYSDSQYYGLNFGDYGFCVMAGDWILRDADGQYRPCDPDTFAALYEEVCDGEEGA